MGTLGRKEFKSSIQIKTLHYFNIAKFYEVFMKQSNI